MSGIKTFHRWEVWRSLRLGLKLNVEKMDTFSQGFVSLMFFKPIGGGGVFEIIMKIL